jgi:hypothetical protein
VRSGWRAASAIHVARVHLARVLCKRVCLRASLAPQSEATRRVAAGAHEFRPTRRCAVKDSLHTFRDILHLLPKERRVYVDGHQV